MKAFFKFQNVVPFHARIIISLLSTLPYNGAAFPAPTVTAGGYSGTPLSPWQWFSKSNPTNNYVQDLIYSSKNASG